MINLINLKLEDLSLIQNHIRPLSDKMNIREINLFSNKAEEKAKAFLICYRLLFNSYNLIDKKDLKDFLLKDINNLKYKYEKTKEILENHPNIRFNSHKKVKKLNSLLDEDIDTLIDIFSKLLERESIINIAKVKGFLLEGKAGDAYKDLFKEENEQ